jgi:pimeloyl-ACP methyl ester carboxylesterase
MRIDNDGVGIDYEVTGEGRPVVLLHGFPDSARLWRHQVPALVEAGHQVIVPNQRGYGGSDQPEEVESYSLLFLAGDVLAVLDELGIARAHVVGHDWGAAVAWMLGSMVPDRVDQLVALSVGHPGAFAGVGYEQQLRSWYMLLFQFGDVAAQWLSNDNWANFRRWTNHPDIDGVIAELERHQALGPGLKWYQANVPPEAWVNPPPEFPPVAASTMGIWSSGDFALTEEQMTNSVDFVAGPWRYERIEGPGHWVQLEAPDVVNELLIDFLST